MKRHIYKGYVIDHDNLGRLYVHSLSSPYSEDCDYVLVTAYEDLVEYYNSDIGKTFFRTDLQAAKHYIDRTISIR